MDRRRAATRGRGARSAMILTDEWSAYQGLGKEYKGGHFTVNHGAGEYWRGGAGTNTVESYFALLKRGVYGSFHHVSKKHLHRYCDEFSFRWNHQAATDGDRTDVALRGAEGKRLTYQSAQRSDVSEAPSEPASTSQSMPFEQCLQAIRNTASRLGIAPINIVETNILRMVRFCADNESVLVTCSQRDHKMVITTSPHRPGCN